MRRPRHLSPEERALWDSVARQTTRLVAAPNAVGTPVAPPLAAPTTDRRPTEDAPPLPDFRVGQTVNHRRDHDLLPGMGQQLARAPVQMDAKAHKRLTRGKLRPEARIDLHGMTLAEAHPALTSFILTEHALGTRLCLVITGKGRPRDHDAPMPVRHGALRHAVPQWLRLAPLASLVLQVTAANFRHGGEGALYVYLRAR